VTPAITPVEACMAVIGLRTIISRKTERITRATLDRIDGIPKEVNRLARQLVRDELTDTWYSDLNYKATLSDLARGIDVQQVQDMADQFPDEYRAVGHALSLAASQVIADLQKLVPTSVYQTVTGQTSLLPDDMRLWKFVSVLEVLDNPLMVFALMNTGALLRSQAHAVRVVYPTLSAAIDAALFDATVKAKAARKGFELAPRAEVGVKAWMGQPPVSPGMLKSSQEAAGRMKDKRAAQDQAKARGTGKTVKMTETASQASNLNAP
jgi:hypothetical protein